MGTLRACLVAVVAATAMGCGFHGKRADWKDSLPPEEPPPLLSDGSNRIEYEELFEYRLGNEDLIAIDVFGHPEFSGMSNVDDRGNVSVKSSGEIIQVAGLTLDEVEGKVGRVVAPYVVGQPQVNVSLLGSRSKYYYCLGGVMHEGVFAMGAKIVRLRDALAAAGFFQDYRADKRRVGIITPDRIKPTYLIADGHDILMGEDKYNAIIKPGDVIFVQDKIIWDIDRFLYFIFRETENVSTANDAVKFWEDAKNGEFGDFSYPRQTITIMW